MRRIIPLIALLFCQASAAFSLNGTVFESAGKASDLDPLLIYSVALAESAWGSKGGVRPYPYAIRAAGKGIYAKDLATAKQTLTNLRATHKNIDVGLMQINLRWNGHRVTDPSLLLNPSINTLTGAAILKEAINSAPGDHELGIGRYHHWSDEARSRSYGARVLAIYNNILEITGRGN